MNDRYEYLYDLFSDESTGYRKIKAINKVNNQEIILKGYFFSLPLNSELEIESEEKDIDSWKVRSYTIDGGLNNAMAFAKMVKDVGEHLAKEIAKVCKPDVFEFIKVSDAEEQLTAIPKVSKKIAKSFINKVKIYEAQNIAYKVLNQCGGYPEDVLTLYDEYGTNMLDILENNPYILREKGFSFELCEKIGELYNIPAYNRERVFQLIKYVLEKNEKHGNTCMYKDEFIRLIKKVDQKETNMLYVMAVAMDDAFTIDEGRIYLTNTYKKEHKIAMHMKRIQDARRYYENRDIENDIKIIENEIGIKYDSEQKLAFNCLKSTGIKVIRGGPGTGKTTIMNGIISLYRKYNKRRQRIALAAPTGSAASKLSISTGLQAKTIHKLLNVRPYKNGHVLCKDEYDQLDFDFFIIDESSMVDTDLMFLLLRAIKSNSTVIFVGDPDQLDSVGCGKILNDLISSGYVEVYTLSHVFRQKSGNSIILNSKKINTGDINLIQDEHFEIRKFEDEDDMQKSVIEEMQKYKFDESRIYTPIKKEKYKMGAVILNRLLQKNLHPGETKDFIRTRTYTFNVGDKVMACSNNYEKGYINGDIGEVINIHAINGYGQMEVKFDNGENILFKNRDAEDLELAYSLTIHKAQGNECPVALVILPDEPKNMLTRKLVYVASTRAKEKNIVFSKKNALEYAIKNHKTEVRTTGLSHQIRLVFSI